MEIRDRSNFSICCPFCGALGIEQMDGRVNNIECPHCHASGTMTRKRKVKVGKSFIVFEWEIPESQKA